MDASVIEKNVKLENLKVGDRVHLYIDDEVNAVNTSTGHVRTKSGARVRMTNGTSWDAVSNGICFKADVSKRAVTEPDNWPPLPGDVWTDSEGKTYMIIGGAGGVKSYSTNDLYYSLSTLKTMTGIKRIFSGAK